MNGVGSAKYGVLTNGHSFRLYEYDPDDRTITATEDFDIEDVATTELSSLSEADQNALTELNLLRRDRYIEFDDAEYFKRTYQEVPVQYQPGTDDEGYELFLNAIKQSLDELTEVLKQFFEDYHDREENSYARDFLETTFPDWKNWREYTGKSANAFRASRKQQNPSTNAPNRWRSTLPFLPKRSIPTSRCEAPQDREAEAPLRTCQCKE